MHLKVEFRVEFKTRWWVAVGLDGGLFDSLVRLIFLRYVSAKSEFRLKFFLLVCSEGEKHWSTAYLFAMHTCKNRGMK